MESSMEAREAVVSAFSRFGFCPLFKWLKQSKGYSAIQALLGCRRMELLGRDGKGLQKLQPEETSLHVI